MSSKNIFLFVVEWLIVVVPCCFFAVAKEECSVKRDYFQAKTVFPANSESKLHSSTYSLWMSKHRTLSLSLLPTIPFLHSLSFIIKKCRLLEWRPVSLLNRTSFDNIQSNFSCKAIAKQLLQNSSKAFPR